METAQKLKVLCLHGYNVDKHVMEFQTRHIRQVLGGCVDFDFVDAPWQARDDPPEDVKRFL